MTRFKMWMLILAVCGVLLPAHGFALSDRERISNRISFEMDECFIVQDDGTVFMDRVTAAKYPEVKLWKEIIAVSANTDAVIGLRKDGTVIGTGSLVSDMEKQAIAQWRNVSQVLRTLGTTYGITSSGTLLYVSEYGDNASDSDRGKALRRYEWKNLQSIAGEYYLFAITEDGHVLSNAPVEEIESLENVVQIAENGTETLFLLSDGSYEVFTELAYEFVIVDHSKQPNNIVQITNDKNQVAFLDNRGYVRASQYSRYYDAALENIVAISGGVAVDREGNLHFTREIETDEEIPVFNLEGYHFD